MSTPLPPSRPRGRRRSRLWAASAALLLTAVAIAAGSQPPDGELPRPPEPPPPAPAVPVFSDEVSVGLVLVPVVVREGSRFASDLERADFRLFADGREVPIETFERSAEAPVSLVVLQDLSGSMAGGKLDASRQAAGYLLERARPGDELAVAGFADGRTWVEVPFPGERTALAEAVASWKAYGTTALHDAVAWLPRIGGSRHPKRAAVLVTDGVDNASHLDPVAARAAVHGAELPVYVLGLGSGNPYVLDDGGDKLYRYADVLNLLAALSGGRYFAIPGDIELKEAVVTIAEELRHQYVLGFTPGGEDFGFHRLTVEVGGGERGLSVATRQGYRGAAPAAWSPGR